MLQLNEIVQNQQGQTPDQLAQTAQAATLPAVQLNPSPVTTTEQLKAQPRTELDIMSLLNKNMERSSQLFQNLSSFYSNPVSPEMASANEAVNTARGEVDTVQTQAEQLKLDTNFDNRELANQGGGVTRAIANMQQDANSRQAQYKMDSLGIQQNAAQRKLNNALLTLQSAQATQSQKLEAAKFMYQANQDNFAQTLQLYKETAPENLGTEVDPTTGDVFAIMRNPVSGEVQTMKAGNVGPQKSYTSTDIQADANGNMMFIGVKPDGSVEVKPLGFQEQQNDKYQVVTDAYGQQRVFNTTTGQFADGGTSLPVGADGTRVDPALPFAGLPKMVYDKVSPIATKFDSHDVVKRFNSVAEGYNFMASIDPNTTNSADNQAIISAFAKIMDPDSVVREGEYATVQKYAQSWSETFGFDILRVFNNQEFLTAEAVQNMQKTAQTKYDTIAKNYRNVYNEYARRIDTVAGEDGIGRQFLTNYMGAYSEQKELEPFGPQGLQSLLEDPYFNKELMTKYPYVEAARILDAVPNITEKELRTALEDEGYFLDPKSSKSAQVAPVVAPVVQKYPEGAKGGQCTTFLHSLVEFPPIGDGKKQKFSYVDKHGIKPQNWLPKVGDIIVTGENETYGHTAMVNKVNPDGSLQLTESNFKGKETVSHDRTIRYNDPKIYGAIRGKLKV